MTAITIDHLSHRYGKTTALDNISLTLPRGATVGLIGPDGVGKSTLLGIIAGVRRIQSGQVRVLDGDMARARDRLALRRQFATVGDIYQGVEGMLGVTCAHGRLHLCEEKYLIEKEWLDDVHYIPLITSFTAHALPLVRYRMDDVLQHDPQPCPCGNCADSVRAIEGRTDDIFILPSSSIIRRIKIYPQTSHHTLARLLPWKTDSRHCRQI